MLPQTSEQEWPRVARCSPATRRRRWRAPAHPAGPHTGYRSVMARPGHSSPAAPVTWGCEHRHPLPRLWDEVTRRRRRSHWRPHSAAAPSLCHRGRFLRCLGCCRQCFATPCCQWQGDVGTKAVSAAAHPTKPVRTPAPWRDDTARGRSARRQHVRVIGRASWQYWRGWRPPLRPIRRQPCGVLCWLSAQTNVLSSNHHFSMLTVLRSRRLAQLHAFRLL